jgi:hypothetical protein
VAGRGNSGGGGGVAAFSLGVLSPDRPMLLIFFAIFLRKDFIVSR